ncbi:hypothetical protein AUC71_09995 [Methyloceanibacter marginalis]|uniref:Uncharacterized protein n=1 Tax=Methyloceanibacter marginalis TaxID=1774971 RepID=A0A1E3WC41_9HYPH|nr:hypothetical protein [Methyloceanibacter marginalis]ODS03356.1 hypothetical protein AUC71_09995 [Methyloceanibacter marginalis]
MWGLPGAAAGACLAFAASLAASWLVGRRLLDIPHAFGEVARITVAVGVMLAALWVIQPPDGVVGLVIEIVTGGVAMSPLPWLSTYWKCVRHSLSISRAWCKSRWVRRDRVDQSSAVFGRGHQK